MKRFLAIFLAAMLLVPGLVSAESDMPSTAPPDFLLMLFQGEDEAVYDQCTPEMQQALGSANGIAATRAQLEQLFGAFEEIQSETAQEQAGYLVGTIVCSQAFAEVTYSVVVSADGLLAGLSVITSAPKAAQIAADPTQFVSEPITLREGEADETQGLLTLPTGEGPFPAVIMMQGSGASDMNATVYGIAPFRDLAEGLAMAGVASIRYDKYSYAHADLLMSDPALLAGFTIEEEYIIDARDALALLQADARISDIYLLGHSLGAMIVPRVMQTLGAQAFAGGILLDGSPLPLWMLQYHQNLAMIPQQKLEDQAIAKAAIDAEAAKLDTVMAASDDELKAMLFFGVSAYYQKDELSVDAAQTAMTLAKPLLIVQGGKDWQVTPADGMDLWQARLAGADTVTYRDYPDMNHMLCEMDGEAANDPSDYQAGDTVSQTLIADIAAWILGR